MGGGGSKKCLTRDSLRPNESSGYVRKGVAGGEIRVERKGCGEGGKMTAEGGPFMVEVDSRFGRSAKTVSEGRIAQTGRIHFPMQACRLIVYGVIH